MRTLLVCLLTAVLVASQSWSGRAQEGEGEKGPGLETLLSAYLQNRLKSAQLALKNLQEGQKAGVATLSDVLTGELEVDKCQLHLRLATDARLIAEHPVLGQLRREFGVPEVGKTLPAGKREVVLAAIEEYLQKSLRRAEQLLDSATLRRQMGRATTSDVLAAENKVEGIKLLLAVERLNLRKASK